MSKKMMKRRLALGALMAFVITGQAWAAELTIDYDNGTYNATGTGIQGSLEFNQDELYSGLKAVNWAGSLNTYNNSVHEWNGNTSAYGGGFGENKSSTGNTIKVHGGDFKNRIIAGYTDTGDANGNALYFNGSVSVGGEYIEETHTLKNKIVGGWGMNDASNNSVYVKNATLAAGIDGGDAQKGNAEGNIIEIDDSTVTYVAAGTARYENGTGNTVNNKVIITNSIDNSTSAGIWGGCTNGYGDSIGNSVEIDESQIKAYIVGGHSSKGDSTQNEVIINGENTVTYGQIFGGRAQYSPEGEGSSAINNVVTINNGTINGKVFGGAGNGVEGAGNDAATQSKANANTVNINGGIINGIIYGGNNEEVGVANGNIVNVTGGTINNKVYGGYGLTEANGNTVEITGGTFGTGVIVYGGASSGEANANVVNVTDVKVGHVYGARTGTDANENKVTIKNSTTGRVFGGVGQKAGITGNANYNVVTIEDNSTINGYVYAGCVDVYCDDIEDDGNTDYNKLIIKDSTVNGYVHCGSNATFGDSNYNETTLTNVIVTDYVTSGHSTVGNAHNNKLTIDGDGRSHIAGKVFGGRANGNGSANNNIVTIINTKIDGKIYGGSSIDDPDTSIEKGWYTIVDVAEAKNNEVILKNSEINNVVYGGYSAWNGIGGDGVNDDVTKDTGYTYVNNNIVTIDGSVVNSDVYGGYVTKGEANNNTVNISGNAVLVNASLFGSNLTTSTGNTLNIGEGWKGSAKSVQNFNTVNFSKGSAITVTDGMTLANAATLNLADGNDYTDTNYAITGELNTGDNATLTIGNIKETTYNIASSYDSETKWKLVNDLMEVESWNTDGQLQVTVKAQSASDIADNLGVSEGTGNLINGIITADNPNGEAVNFVENIMNSGAPDDIVKDSLDAAQKMAEAGGQSATAARIVNNVTGVTNDRLSFNCGHSAPHKGGHGVGLFEEGSGADVWVEYVHGKDKVEDMPSTAGTSSYEGQFNGIVMGVDFKKVNKFQSGVAFNYGEGDTNSVGSAARTHSDYDFWGIGYYGNIHNDDSNVIFDISYGKTDSDVTQTGIGGVLEAAPETTTWSAGVKVEKLYQNENVQIVPYTGLRFMSINTDDYTTKGEGFMYNMERQNIWLLPVGVSIKQEVTNDNGWTVSPRIDLSYIWAFGDTNSNMEVKSGNGISPIGYDVMDDGSFLGLVGIEAHKGQWGYGVSYSYQKGDHSESKKWFVDVNYSF